MAACRPPELPLTVIVHTRNEETQIAACLHGLKGWAAEVMVADMASTDQTLAIARPLSDTVLELPVMEEFDAARNVSAAAASQPWILMLDADERLNEKVKETIERLVRANEPAVAAYQLPFKVISFGGWIQHAGNWWPSYKSPPLLRAGRFRFSGMVHDPAMVDGKVVRVHPTSEDDAILHLSHRDLSHYFDKLNRYTTLEALKRDEPGSWEAAAKGLGEVFAWYFDTTHGKLDGAPGFFLAFGSAVYEALVQLKLMERNGITNLPPDAATFLGVALQAARAGKVSEPFRDHPVEAGKAIEGLVPGLTVTKDVGRASIEIDCQTLGLNWQGPDTQAAAEVAVVAHRDALRVLGGGEVQLFETVRSLETEGFRCIVGIGDVPESGSMVHAFSLHHGNLKSALRGRPYVLTPIYWDRAELHWLAPKLMMAAGRAETLSELEAAYASLRGQADAQRQAGAFVSLLPEPMRCLVLGAAMVLPNAHCEAEMLKASVGADLPQVRVIPNGVSQTSMNENSHEGQEEEPFVLCAGRLEVNKNQLALLAACRMIGAQLVLVGPELDPAYAALCKGIAGPCAEFLGPRSREDVLGLMARAAVHALPSFAETPGLANLEAMAMRCPLVCSNRGAEREYFGDDALYCDPLDIGSIAEALQLSMKRGRAKPQKQPVTWDMVGRLTAGAYREILGRASGIGSGDE